MLHTTPLPHCSRLRSESHCSKNHPRCGARALRPSSPNSLEPRLTFVTLLLTRKESARACRVGTTHMAKWTADPWAFHCSCAVTVCIVNWQFRISGTSIHKGHAKIVHMSPVMSDPHVTIQHSLLNTCVC